MAMIIVLKLNLTGGITWQYDGRVLRREHNMIVLEAFFNRPDMPFMDVTFRENDRFVETFYTDRWYNIFEIHDREDDKLKGWYCNISRPAVLGKRTLAMRRLAKKTLATGNIPEETVSYVDLALDLWVSADGIQTVLDKDEFETLHLAPRDRQQALAALADLKKLFKSKQSAR